MTRRIHQCMQSVGIFMSSVSHNLQFTIHKHSLHHFRLTKTKTYPHKLDKNKRLLLLYDLQHCLLLIKTIFSYKHDTMMNTTEYSLSPTPTYIISQSDKRKFSEQQQQQQDVTFSTPNFSRRDDNDVGNNDGTTISSPLRDDVESVRRIIAVDDDDDDDDVDVENHYHYDCSSPSSKRCKKSSLDGIFRPTSSSLSPPPLLPRSDSFYHEISELSDSELSFLALPTLPLSTTTTTTTTPTIALLPISSLSPHFFDILSLSSNSRKEEDPMDFISMRDSNNKQEDSSSTTIRRSRQEILSPSLRKNHHHHHNHHNHHNHHMRYKLSIDVSSTSATQSEHIYSPQGKPTSPAAA
jgi:hypothetical protein